MASTQVELAKLHDEYPILNDLEGSVDFWVGEGQLTPSVMKWYIDPGFQRQLQHLGVTERIKQLLSIMIRGYGGCPCQGSIEFMHGQFATKVRAAAS